MALTARERPREASTTLPPPQGTTAPAPPATRPLRDNPALILFWIAVLLAALVAMIALADRSAQLSPDFLSEVVLYALSVADLTILVALVFVLARNIIKLVVERRRGLPFARFRSKLVAVLLGMTLIPASLVLIVGSELIRNSAARWFSAPIDEVLSSARQIASDYYQERQVAVGGEAGRIAVALEDTDLAAGVGAVRDLVSPEVTERRVDMVEVYRLVTDPTRQVSCRWSRSPPRRFRAGRRAPRASVSRRRWRLAAPMPG
jgi:two-component system, NtrC family, nitrogen regulation sensor histidine kinase NtrY